MLDGGLVLSLQHRQNRAHLRLNPCYVGRWTSTLGLMNPLYGAKLRLNPCYVGRWTSTSHYKTILIINKLKSLAKEIFTSLNKKLTLSKRVQRYDFFLNYASQLILNFQVNISIYFTTLAKTTSKEPNLSH